MDARFYNSEDIDIQRLAGDLVNVYLAQGYQAQQIGNPDQILVQLKKGGDFEAIIGMQAAISVTLQRNTGGVLAMIGQQRWLDKAAVGAVGIVAFPVLWPLALTAGAGAIRQASLGNQVLNVVDGLVRQQRPGLIAGPVPAYLLPQMQQQWGQPNQPQPQTPYYVASSNVVEGSVPPQPMLPPAPTPMMPFDELHCPQCNTPYEQGDTFCTGCGRPLTTPRQYCPNCHSELKLGASFCPKCGVSTFPSSQSAQQTVRPATPPQQPPKPVYQPPAQPVQPQTPMYTPPPATPVYQPPVPPVKPPTPTYTPPPTQEPVSAPQPQVYYVPSTNQQTTTPAAPPAQKKPEEPYYVPPKTQQPVVPPQPKVTLVQSKPRQEPPAPQKPHPQKQYYIPSKQDAQQVHDASLQPTVADYAAPTLPDQQAQPANVPTSSQGALVDPDVPWGSLIFNNGQQNQLKGERAVIGRYDHDLGGLMPDVDLGKVPGADTVSRVHAALENTGNTYTLTDLNSTNSTRINGKRLEPDTPTPINDGDTVQFGKVSCTFKKGS